VVTRLDTTAAAVEPEGDGLGGAAITEEPRRRGRPRGQRAGVGGLQVQTTKSYRLMDESHRTVGQLRQILGQRRLPDDARVTFDGDRITIEWSD
jgi:hypothetical protein